MRYTTSMKHMTKYFSVFKTPKGYISAAIVLLVLAGWGLSGEKTPLFSGTLTVVKRDIAQKVSVTGRVKSVSDVALAFEKSGRVSRVYHEVGAEVKPGDALVSLENADLYAQLQQTQAAVKVQQAKLDALKAGSAASDIRIAEIYVINAKAALEDTRRAAVDALTAAQTNADVLCTIKSTHSSVIPGLRPRNSILKPTVNCAHRWGARVGRTMLDRGNLCRRCRSIEKVAFPTYLPMHPSVDAQMLVDTSPKQ